MAPTSFVARSANTFDSLTRRSRPRVGIDLLGQEDGFVASYTTRDRINGVVSIAVDQDTSFQDVDITFEGIWNSLISKSPSPTRSPNELTNRSRMWCNRDMQDVRGTVR